MKPVIYLFAASGKMEMPDHASRSQGKVSRFDHSFEPAIYKLASLAEREIDLR
jgi:hypothetical protein